MRKKGYLGKKNSSSVGQWLFSESHVFRWIQIGFSFSTFSSPAEVADALRAEGAGEAVSDAEQLMDRERFVFHLKIDRCQGGIE